MAVLTRPYAALHTAGVAFSGTSDYIKIPTWEHFATYTIYFVAYRNAGGATHYIFDSGPTGDAAWRVYIDGATDLISIIQAQASINNSIVVWDTGVWAACVISRDSAITSDPAFKVWYRPLNSNVITYAHEGNDNRVMGTAIDANIGSRANGSSLLNGRIAEVAVWNTLLNDTEVTNLLMTKTKYVPLQIRPARLRGYWPLYDYLPSTTIVGRRVEDYSGNHYFGRGIGTSNLRAVAGSGINYPLRYLPKSRKRHRYANQPGGAPPVTTTGIMTPRTNYWGDL